MKKISTTTLIITLLFCSKIILLIVNIYYANRIEKYIEYYEATETLLDTLEEHDNWVDRFDPVDYYEAREALK